jgi:energy-coupling factor transporter ATP-binding protein EcfA2
MINSAVIRNCRCYKDAGLTNCRTLNILVGKSASGKSALLEALFLALGPSPEIALRLRGWRGFDRVMSGTQIEIESAVWSDLFHRFDLDTPISIDLRGSGKHTRSLHVSYAQSETFVPITDEPKSLSFAPSPVQFEWIRHDGASFKVRPQFSGQGFQFVGTEHPPVDASFFSSSHPYFTADTAKRLSNLSKRRQDGYVVKQVLREFPFIRGLDVQSHVGTSMLHADIPYLPEKVPVNLISSGVNKFITLLVAIAAQPGAVVFVDEMENGFHYQRYFSVWKVLYEACKRFEVQLFASSHSRECLEALADACRDNPDDVSLIRSEMRDGVAELKQFQGSTMFKTLEIGEIR